MSESNENQDQLALLRELVESLREIVAWARVAGYPVAKHALTTALDSDEKRLVYHLTDGRRSVKEIEELSGVNVRYISEWGREWEKMGIVEPSRISRIKGRRQKVFDLDAFALRIPDQPDREAK